MSHMNKKLKSIFLLLAFTVPMILIACKPKEPAKAITCDVRGRTMGEVGTTSLVECPANCTSGSVWGTDKYTDDSAVCRAAVHAGVIKAAKGGTVRVKVTPGLDKYTPSTRNGIESRSWGKWRKTIELSKP